jgi:hypothetical protein
MSEKPNNNRGGVLVLLLASQVVDASCPISLKLARARPVAGTLPSTCTNRDV